jgi:RHS repeat-associated protein
LSVVGSGCPSQVRVKSQGRPPPYIGKLSWNANSTLASLNIIDPFNSSNTQTCNYAHDDLTRIASVSCGTSTWTQTFACDAFGNLTNTVPTGGTGNSFQPTYNLNNQYATLSGATPTYDANGNVLKNGAHTYTWDVDGHYLSVDGTAVTYDALGRRVQIAASQEIFYLPDGSQEIFNGQTATHAALKLPGGAQAIYNSANGGLVSYSHADHLGSLRLTTTPTQTFSASLGYAPFGEPYAESSSSVDQSFTGQPSNFAPDAYDFPAREYSYQGRWSSPDPAGLAAVDPTNPQSWNRYAYVVKVATNIAGVTAETAATAVASAKLVFDGLVFGIGLIKCH